MGTTDYNDMVVCIDESGVRWWFDKSQITPYTPIIYSEIKYTPGQTHLGHWILRLQSQTGEPTHPFRLLTEQSMAMWAIEAGAGDVIQAIGSGINNYEQ